MAERDYKQLVAPKSGSLNRVSGSGSSSGNALASFADQMFAKSNEALLKQRAVDGAAAGAMQPFRRNAEGQLEKPVVPEGFFSHSSFKQNERNAILTNSMSIFDGELRIGLSQLHQEIKQDSEIGHADKAANYAEQSVDRIDLAIANAPDEIKPALMAKAHEMKATHELSLSDDSYEIDRFQSLGAITTELTSKLTDTVETALSLEAGDTFAEQFALVQKMEKELIAGIEALSVEFPGTYNASKTGDLIQAASTEIKVALGQSELFHAYSEGGREAVMEVINEHESKGSDIKVLSHMHTILARLDARETHERDKKQRKQANAQIYNNVEMVQEYLGLLDEHGVGSPLIDDFLRVMGRQIRESVDPETYVASHNPEMHLGLVRNYESMKMNEKDAEADRRENTVNYLQLETHMRRVRTGSVLFTHDKHLAERTPGMEYIMDAFDHEGTPSGSDLSSMKDLMSQQRQWQKGQEGSDSYTEKMEGLLEVVTRNRDPGTDTPSAVDAFFSEETNYKNFEISDLGGEEPTALNGGKVEGHPILSPNFSVNRAAISFALKFRTWGSEIENAFKSWSKGNDLQRLGLLLSAEDIANGNLYRGDPYLSTIFSEGSLADDMPSIRTAFDRALGGHDREAINAVISNPEEHEAVKDRFNVFLKESREAAENLKGMSEVEIQAAMIKKHPDLEWMQGDDRQKDKAILDMLNGQPHIWQKWLGTMNKYIIGDGGLLYDTKYREKRPADQWNILGYSLNNPFDYLWDSFHRGWDGVTSYPLDVIHGGRITIENFTEPAKEIVNEAYRLQFGRDPDGQSSVQLNAAVARQVGQQTSSTWLSGKRHSKWGTRLVSVVPNEHSPEWNVKLRHPRLEHGEGVQLGIDVFEDFRAAVIMNQEYFADHGITPDDLFDNSIVAHRFGHFRFHPIEGAKTESGEQLFALTVNLKPTGYTGGSALSDRSYTWYGEKASHEGRWFKGEFTPGRAIDGEGKYTQYYGDGSTQLGITLAQSYRVDGELMENSPIRLEEEEATARILNTLWQYNYKNENFNRSDDSLEIERTLTPILKRRIKEGLRYEARGDIPAGTTEKLYSEYSVLNLDAYDIPEAASTLTQMGSPRDNRDERTRKEVESGNSQNVPLHILNEGELPLQEPVIAVEALRGRNPELVEMTDSLIGDGYKQLQQVNDLMLPTIFEQEGYEPPPVVPLEDLTLEKYEMPIELASVLRNPDRDQIELLGEAIDDPEIHITLPVPLYKMVQPVMDLLNLDIKPVPSSKNQLVELVPVDPKNPPESLKPFMDPRLLEEPPSPEDRIAPPPPSPPVSAKEAETRSMEPSDNTVDTMDSLIANMAEKPLKGEAAAPPPVEQDTGKIDLSGAENIIRNVNSNVRDDIDLAEAWKALVVAYEGGLTSSYENARSELLALETNVKTTKAKIRRLGILLNTKGIATTEVVKRVMADE